MSVFRKFYKSFTLPARALPKFVVDQARSQAAARAKAVAVARAQDQARSAAHTKAFKEAQARLLKQMAEARRRAR